MTLRLLKSTVPALHSNLPPLPKLQAAGDGEGAQVPRLRGKALVSMRLRILARSGRLCECDLCTTSTMRKALTWRTFELDHVIRVADGGTNAMSNLRALHVDCHARITREQNEQVAAFGRVLPPDPTVRTHAHDDMPC